jgi:hypothetical protein
MCARMKRQIEGELSLMTRFAEAYRPKFAAMIRELNRDTPGDPRQSLRLCVEAMGMLLDSQARLARVLSRLDERDSVYPGVARV